MSPGQPGRSPGRTGAWSQFWSHSPPSAAVRRRPPGAKPGRSRTVAAPGGRWPAWLESVLGETPQEFESPILRHADLQKHCSSPPTGGRSEFPPVSFVVSVLSVGRRLRRLNVALFARSQACQTAKNGEAHAAEACALPFRAGRDRPRPGCRLLLGAAGYPPIDRKLLGERAPSRRSVPLTAACRSSAMAHRLVDLYSGGRRGVRAYRSQQAPVRATRPAWRSDSDRRLRIASPASSAP